MKKYYSFAILALALGFTACDVETDEEPGGTNVEKMAGRWEVTVNVVDADGNIIYEDPYNMGVWELQTYNTAENEGDRMWVTDIVDGEPAFWEFKVKASVDYQARTFQAENLYYNDDMREIADSIKAGNPLLDEDGDPLVAETMTITGGKVLEGAAKNLHGMPNDSIVLDVTFTDDSYGFIWRISGQRYTGFYE